MRVSIITITYNSAQTLEQTILSVINQSHPDIEYIVVDGLSTDTTMALVDKYRSKISKVVSEKDKGLYDALNKGIDMATGDVIGIIHSDDFYTDDNVIAEYVKIFSESDYDAVYADLFYVDREDVNKITRTWKSGEINENSFKNGWMPPHPTFFVKREVYKKFGKFNPSFKNSADYELMLRFIQKNKIRTGYLKKFVVKMRVGGVSNSSVQNRVNANMEDRKAWEINGLKPRFYTLYFKPFRKIFQFFKR